MKAKKAAGLKETRRIRRRRRWSRWKGQGRRRRWKGERGKEEGVEEGKKKRIEEEEEEGTGEEKEVGWSGVLLAGEGARLLVGLTKYCSVTLAWQPYQP